ncbi:MAG: hypothetical protein RL223_5032, partial [Pseudomonadota bacterium]
MSEAQTRAKSVRTFVGKIVSRLAQTYFAAASEAARDFQASFSVTVAMGQRTTRDIERVGMDDLK